MRMTTSVASKPQPAAHTVEISAPVSVIVSQSSKVVLVEMTEAEYQQIIQCHIEAQVAETGSSDLSSDYPKTVCSPHTPSVCQPVKQCAISESNNHRSVDVQEIKMQLGYEDMAASGAELSCSAMEKVMCVIDQTTDLCHQTGGQLRCRRPSPPARVCLEKRFLSMLCHSTATAGKTTEADTEKWHQQPSATLKDVAVLPVKLAHSSMNRISNVTQHLENCKPPAGLSDTKLGKRPKSQLDQTQRREMHNRKERDRRRKIRLCCDQLNLLVPFCSADTDKATTLKWTTAFLKYIREIHGDSLKQDFQNTFCNTPELQLKPNCVQEVQHLEKH
ncbi:uncharacterized protein [Paramisgurnus dabryanus]|uniref:uncharacterized protein n=1 Tax=Paramisgurnus dabryanus TaxID=90735 RepID=UPI0031F445C1